MLHRLFQLPALLPGVAGSQLNLYPTAAFVHSAATLCTDLQVDLGQQLKLQHFVAALEPSDAAVVAGSGVKYLQGEAFLLDEAGLNFTMKQVLGAWPRGAAVQLQHLHLREEAKLQNAYQLRCALHASEFLKLTKPLNLEVRTDKVYDWFRYVGYVRWAKHMMDHLQAATTATHFVDLGGGSGWLSMLVKAVIPVVQVVYTDISQAALEEAAASFRANGLMVETLQGDFFDPLQGRRIDFIFSYPLQVPPSSGHDGASRGSPEVALATPQGRSEAHFLRRFCRELVLDPQGVAWLGVTWELLQQTLEDCCVRGWNVTIPEAFRLDLAIPGTLLELRVASPNVGIAPCATRAAAQCAACPEWLSREQRLKAAEGGHATAQTKMGIELMREAAEAQGQKRSTLQRQAIQWYKRAAKQGEPIAATRLGFLYLTADGLRKDRSKGLKLLWQAALQGEASAMFGLAETFALDAAVDDALKWYRRAAAGGWREAKRQLGLFLLSRGMASEEAEEMLREAAVEGDPRALQLLKDYFPKSAEL